MFESGKLRNFFVVNVLFSQSGSSALPPVVSVFIEDSRMPLTSCHEPGSSPHGRGDIPWPLDHRSFQGGCYFCSLPDSVDKPVDNQLTRVLSEKHPVVNYRNNLQYVLLLF